MTDRMRRLESVVERGMEVLRGVRDPALDPACARRVSDAAVRSLRANAHGPRAGRRWLAVMGWSAAAAILLAAGGLRQAALRPRAASESPVVAAAEDVAAWSDSFDQSTNTVTMILLDDSWPTREPTVDDAKRDLRDFIDSFDSSLGA